MHRPLRMHSRLALNVASFAALLSAACAPMESEQQAPLQEASSEAAVYESAATQSAGEQGSIVSYKRESLPFINTKSWLIVYRSTDALGNPNAVSGTVLVPNSHWFGRGPRPIIAFAHGTVGITDDCAPSKTMATGLFLEQNSVATALSMGWAVALTDYEGLGTPGNHTYVVAAAEGHSVLDSVRAAMRVPGSGLDKNAPIVIWGYSQGGGAAAAAAELAQTYAPELQIKGVAAGGAAADLVAIAANLEGSLFYGFQSAAALGLDTAYPELNLDAYLNEAGKSEFGGIANGTKSGCLVDLLVNFAFKRTSDYTTSNPMQTPAWQKRLAENMLGLSKPGVPAFVYHGDLDEIIPLAVGVGLRDRWCELGATVKWSVYPFGEHLVAQALALADVVQWTSDRLAGRQAPNTCAR